MILPRRTVTLLAAIWTLGLTSGCGKEQVGGATEALRRILNSYKNCTHVSQIGVGHFVSKDSRGTYSSRSMLGVAALRGDFKILNAKAFGPGEVRIWLAKSNGYKYTFLMKKAYGEWLIDAVKPGHR